MGRPQGDLAHAVASVRFRRQQHLIGQSLHCPFTELDDIPQKLRPELGLDDSWSVCLPSSSSHTVEIASGREHDIYFLGPKVLWDDDDRICRSKLRDLGYIDSEGHIFDPYYLNQLTKAVRSGVSYFAVSIVMSIDPEDAPKRLIERLVRWDAASKLVELTITGACLSNTPMIWSGRFPRW